MTTNAVGLGILGTGSISATVVGQLRDSTLVRPVAVSSRTLDKAGSFATRFDIPKAYDTMEALLDDPAVEAVYVGLPHALHVEAVVAALDAGKHVLCEKPMGRTARELQQIADHARSGELIVTEGFMLRHQPQWKWVEGEIAAGSLGTVKAVHIFNALTVPRSPPDPMRLSLPGDGSLLLDIGCYSVHLARTIFGEDPIDASARIEFDATGRDTLVDAALRFAEGSAHITLATTLRSARRIHILGTDGNIEVFFPVHSPSGEARLLVTLKGEDGPAREMKFPIGNQYGDQLEEFSRAIREQCQPLVPLSHTIGNARTLDAIAKSAAHAGAWTAL
jgi:predicted dehydrogenase